MNNANTMEEDILFGRGNGINHHKGNEELRQIIRDRLEEYFQKRLLVGTKRAIAEDIVSYFRKKNRRFLRKNKAGQWLEVDDESAASTIQQCFRDVRKQQRQSKEKVKSEINVLYSRSPSDSNSTLVDQRTRAKREIEDEEERACFSRKRRVSDSSVQGKRLRASNCAHSSSYSTVVSCSDHEEDDSHFRESSNSYETNPLTTSISTQPLEQYQLGLEEEKESFDDEFLEFVKEELLDEEEDNEDGGAKKGAVLVTPKPKAAKTSSSSSSIPAEEGDENKYIPHEVSILNDLSKVAHCDLNNNNNIIEDEEDIEPLHFRPDEITENTSSLALVCENIIAL